MLTFVCFGLYLVPVAKGFRPSYTQISSNAFFSKWTIRTSSTLKCHNFPFGITDFNEIWIKLKIFFYSFHFCQTLKMSASPLPLCVPFVGAHHIWIQNTTHHELDVSRSFMNTEHHAPQPRRRYHVCHVQVKELEAFWFKRKHVKQGIQVFYISWLTNGTL